MVVRRLPFLCDPDAIGTSLNTWPNAALLVGRLLRTDESSSSSKHITTSPHHHITTSFHHSIYPSFSSSHPLIFSFSHHPIFKLSNYHISTSANYHISKLPHYHIIPPKPHTQRQPSFVKQKLSPNICIIHFFSLFSY
jgi:hypothetical protein